MESCVALGSHLSPLSLHVLVCRWRGEIATPACGEALRRLALSRAQPGAQPTVSTHSVSKGGCCPPHLWGPPHQSFHAFDATPGREGGGQGPWARAVVEKTEVQRARSFFKGAQPRYQVRPGDFACMAHLA